MAHSATIDRAFLTSTRPAINKALIALGKELGVKFETGSCSFDDLSATFKLTMAVVTKGSKGKSARDLKAEADWATYATKFGLKKAWLGKKVQSRRFVTHAMTNTIRARAADMVLITGGVSDFERIIHSKLYEYAKLQGH